MQFSQDELTLLPGNEGVAFYQEHGYYKSKKIFTYEEIEAAIVDNKR